MTISNKQQLDTLRTHINALVSPKTVKKDSDGYFQPSTDKKGIGSAVLRFLPALPNEELPFVQIYNHAFQDDNTWFIDNCPTTLSLPCPVCEVNSALVKSGYKYVASRRKCKMYHVSNVLVVSDPGQPENEGKVFLYKYAATIFEKIEFALDSVNPFDAHEGANFRLRIERNGQFTDYGKSSFDAPSPIGDEDEIARILSKRRSLSDIIAPHQFKSYEELKRKFEGIVGAAKAA